MSRGVESAFEEGPPSLISAASSPSSARAGGNIEFGSPSVAATPPFGGGVLNLAGGGGGCITATSSTLTGTLTPNGVGFGKSGAKCEK